MEIPKLKIATIVLLFVFSYQITLTQHLSSSKNIGIAAATSIVSDISSLDWNPAGLSNISDWRFEFGSYITPRINTGIAFHNFGIAKNFSYKHSVAVRYSPGSTLEFVVPTTFTFFDNDNNPISANFDKKISYNQTYAFGYSSKVLDNISFGASSRFYEVKISDTKYSLDTNNIINSQVHDYASSQWGVDIGGIYNFSNKINIGIVFKNLFLIKENELNENLRVYQLKLPKVLRFGLSYETPQDIMLALDLDTKKNLNFGLEFPTINFLKFRSSIYSSNFKNFDAAALGISFRYQNLEFDLSYLKFFNQINRKGSSNLKSFQESEIFDIEYNKFTPDRISLSVGIKLGKTKEQLVKIEYVEIFGEIFPSAYQTYAFRPIGKARIKNISSKAVESRVSFYIKNFMDEPTQSKPLKLLPGEIVEVPIFAVFNSAIQFVKSFAIYDGNIFVYATPTSDFDDKYQTPVIIRGRNDWNGDVSQLRYFITPSDPEVLKFSRQAIKNKDNQNTNSLLIKFENAKDIFNELSKVITYINDPNQSTDFVQYPTETLNLHGGDCDDITVCYSALLESVGIKVALIDVVPPENPSKAHIYMMFDTEIPVENASLISDNSKKYIIRKNFDGKETIWIPVETTLISKGFSDAWNYAASEYFKDAIINNGLSKGWIRIVDLNLNY